MTWPSNHREVTTSNASNGVTLLPLTTVNRAFQSLSSVTSDVTALVTQLHSPS